MSSGCAHCYAEKMAKRNPAALGQWGPNANRVIASASYWNIPMGWERRAEKEKRRIKVFCGSMMDIFEDRNDLVSPRLKTFGIIDATPHLDWLLVTKRPENIVRMWPGIIDKEPRKNVWLITTVEDQENYNRRIDALMACRTMVPVLGLSVEPMLGPVHLDALVDWVIVGGESGPQARPFFDNWALDLLAQCRFRGIPFFFKQYGSNAYTQDDEFGNVRIEKFRGTKGDDPARWPEDMRIQQFPKIISL